MSRERCAAPTCRCMEPWPWGDHWMGHPHVAGCDCAPCMRLDAAITRDLAEAAQRDGRTS